MTHFVTCVLPRLFSKVTTSHSRLCSLRACEILESLELQTWRGRAEDRSSGPERAASVYRVRKSNTFSTAGDCNKVSATKKQLGEDRHGGRNGSSL